MSASTSSKQAGKKTKNRSPQRKSKRVPKQDDVGVGGKQGKKRKRNQGAETSVSGASAQVAEVPAALECPWGEKLIDSSIPEKLPGAPPRGAL